MRLTAVNVLINAAYYAVTVVLLPWVCLWLEAAVGVGRAESAALRAVGVVLVVLGAALQVWCIVLFQRFGRGTPSLAAPTRALVVRGPYRFVRNPMNIGEVVVFVGMAAWFGSAALVAYAAAAMVAFDVFVVRVEEPRHAREFGEAYEGYRERVGRWRVRVGGLGRRGRGAAGRGVERVADGSGK